MIFYFLLYDFAVIENNYLQDVKEDIKEVYEKLEKQDEIIHDTIEEVSDISSATSPDFSDVNEWKKKSVEKVKELDEDLASFTSEGNETNVKELMHQIETVMNNAKTSEGKARFADFKGASDNSELKKLMEYNEEKQNAEMEKAKEARESTVKGLNDTSSKDVVNKAYQEFKDGDIGYEQYIAILDSVKNTGDNLDEKTIKENADEEFIKYLKDRGMLKDYLADHKAVAEQENIKKLGDEAKGFLDVLKTGYKNGDLSKEDYEELRSAVIDQGKDTVETENFWVNNFYSENGIVHKSDNSEHVYAVGEDQDFEYGGVSAGAGYYENDLGTSDQIGGSHTVSALHVEGDLDTGMAEGDFHQDLLKAEGTAQIGGSSAFGLNLPLPVAKAEAKGYEIEGNIQAGSDMPYIEGLGVGGEASILKGKAIAGVDEGSIGIGAKAAIAEAEGSVYAPIPFTDTEIKVIFGASAGGIGGEAKIGKKTLLDLRFLFGGKIGIEFE